METPAKENLIIELNLQEFDDLSIAKESLEIKIGSPVSYSKAVQLLANIFNSGTIKVIYNKYPKKLNYEQDLCPICKREFFPATRAKKTCSIECRKILYKRKKHGLLPSSISQP